jgi:Coenzyme PQQ synthesis protein D (PqqD)
MVDLAVRARSGVCLAQLRQRRTRKLAEGRGQEDGAKRALKIYRVSSAVLRSRVGGDEVMLNADTGVYYLVTGSGRDLLADLEAGRPLKEAAMRLSEQTGEKLDRVLADGEAFVSTMVDRGLLEESAG